MGRYSDVANNLSGFSGDISGCRDQDSLGQARGKGQDNCREGSAAARRKGPEDSGSEGDREARRLIEHILQTRGTPCPRKMAYKAREILRNLGIDDV